PGEGARDDRSGPDARALLRGRVHQERGDRQGARGRPAGDPGRTQAAGQLAGCGGHLAPGGRRRDPEGVRGRLRLRRAHAALTAGPAGRCRNGLDLALGAGSRLPGVDESYLLAGRFGAEARLTPKALRLYAELGLLVPRRTDPATGYRYYHRDQLDRARLISRLRRLELPLAKIATLLDAEPGALEVELRSWLKARHDQLGRQTELVDAIVRGGAESP